MQWLQWTANLFIISIVLGICVVHVVVVQVCGSAALAVHSWRMCRRHKGIMILYNIILIAVNWIHALVNAIHIEVVYYSKSLIVWDNQHRLQWSPFKPSIMRSDESPIKAYPSSHAFSLYDWQMARTRGRVRPNLDSICRFVGRPVSDTLLVLQLWWPALSRRHCVRVLCHKTQKRRYQASLAFLAFLTSLI